MKGSAGSVEFVEYISVVVPCFRGESTLSELVEELSVVSQAQKSPAGNSWRVDEIILVSDGGGQDLNSLITKISEKNSLVKGVFLTRNFGQHAATLAGINESSSRWVVSLDEDGQHNPSEIGLLLDSAKADGALLAYGTPRNPPGHGRFRNFASRATKTMASRFLGVSSAALFQSFRLIDGDVARHLAETVGPNVYFDIALGWFIDSPTTALVTLRSEEKRKSSYSPGRLLRHFWMLFLSIGTRTMRSLTVLGLIASIVGLGLGVFFIAQRLFGTDFPAGWASQITVSLFLGGLTLLFLGLISEYLGSMVNRVMGKPTYFSVPNRQHNPHSDNA